MADFPKIPGEELQKLKDLSSSEEVSTFTAEVMGSREIKEDFEIDTYLAEFPKIPMGELQKLKDLSSCEEVFTFTAGYKQRDLVRKEQRGERAILSHPLVFVLSMNVQSEGESVAIYGTINATYKHPEECIELKLFRHESNDAQKVGPGGDLALKGTDYTYGIDHACIPLWESSIDVKLRVLDAEGKDKDFATESFQLNVEIGDDGYEVVRSEFIDRQGVGNLTLQYIVIPYGVSCCLAIYVYYRYPPEEDYSFNVSGSIVVEYGNTYGNYSESREKCVLFDKQGTEFETVNSGECLQLSRCWVALPAYSSLLVKIDLSKSGSDEKIVTGTIKLDPQQGGSSDDSIVLDDYIITADAAWFPADYHWKHHHPKIIPTQLEEIDTEEQDKSSDAGLSSVTSPQRHRPPPFHAVEIFSVFIGGEKSTAQVYGSAEVLSNDEIVRSIFERGVKDAFTLSQDMKFIPVEDVYKVFLNFNPLEMKLNIKYVEDKKDVEDKRDVEPSLAKGYGDWGTHILDDALCYDRQLCSFVRGKHGFAAVHYSIFSKAVAANIKVVLEYKEVPADTNLSVWGSLIAQYSRFDYSSKYHKDCYRSVLFRRDEDDPAQLRADCSIPLSRSLIVVPLCSLVVDVDLSFGTFAVKSIVVIEQKESKTKVKCGETCDYKLGIEVDWQPIEMKYWQPSKMKYWQPIKKSIGNLKSKMKHWQPIKKSIGNLLRCIIGNLATD